MKTTKFTLAIILFFSFIQYSCIENDVDYPYVEGAIKEFSVEGMTSAALINKNTRTIDVTISDEADIQNLTITRLTLENEGTLYPDPTKCINADAFPVIPFVSLDSIPETADTRINFTTPLNLLIETYQEYEWTITVNQNIPEMFEFEDVEFVQDPVFDRDNKQVIVYVPVGTDLSEMKIYTTFFTTTKEIVTPDPLEGTFDFRTPQKFEVTAFGRTETWTVNAVESDDVQYNVAVYPRTKQVVVTGKVGSGSDLLVEYKRPNARVWQEVPEEQISINGTTFTAMITGLTPLSQYDCRVTIREEVVLEQTVTTGSAAVLENGSFDNWHYVTNGGGKDVYFPWAQDGIQYWATGNQGATIGGPSNSVPSTDISNTQGYSAMLQSVFVTGIKFAAGNMFVGNFVGIDLTDGILEFGRQFISYPTKLKFDYKYTSVPINKYLATDNTTSDKFKEYIGRADSCHVYWALTDWDSPLEIRTKPSDRQLLNVNDPNIIAYGEFVSGVTTNQYQTIELDFVYRNNRAPKYLVIVATSSKYGDYFCGGEGSTLWLDEMELVYD